MDSITQLNSALSGRYELEREVGRGGMATVYLTRDLRHDRRVALKLLNPELGAVLGVERFLAEIKVTANLQHPNLLPLFDSGATDGLLFYVMPFVEGESLRARLEREKQLPIDEALRIATAVASALDYAHRHDVIHRDLKPENILLHEGQPLVADFGIALAVTKAGGNRITQTGLSLGTPQYMSPEQATGDRLVDGRTDIYSLGAVLYEMLTGEPPHIGSTSQAIIARVLTEKPRAVRTSRPNVPPYVEAAIERALEKLRADRFGTAHEFADALSGRGSAGVAGALGVAGAVGAAGVTGTSGAPGSALGAATVAALPGVAAHGAQPALSRALRSPLTTVAGFLLALAVGAAWWVRDQGTEAPGAVRLSFSVAPSEQLSTYLGRTVALSPDGRTLVFSTADSGGRVHLFVRALDDLRSKVIAGTEGATMPFFSPDGHWLGFFDGRQLKKVPVEGGTPTQLAELRGLFGATWGAGGIVVSTGSKLALVPSGGGTPRLLSPGDSSSGYWPVTLPGGKAALYVDDLGASARIRAVALESGRTTALDVLGSFPIGVVAGQLIYARFDGAIMAAPFDVKRLKMTGSPTVVVGEVQQNPGTSEAKAAVSATGSLAYVSGSGIVQVVLVDLHGAARSTAVPPGRYNDPRFSPDGKRVAVDLVSAGRSDVWIYELASGAPRRLTAEGTVNMRPEWTPDGKRVLFRTNRAGRNTGLWWQPVDGSGAAQLLVSVPGKDVWQGLLAPDGRSVVYRTGTVGTADIWYRRLDGDTAEKGVATTPFTEYAPKVSPDGRWIAYASDESGGGFQIYVRPFPGPGAQFPVSVGGGNSPVWSHDGRRIFFTNGQKLVAASIVTTPTFAVAARDVLFDGNYQPGTGHASFDVSPDGKSFLMLRPITSAEEQIVVVHDWKRELQQRAKGAGAP